MNAADFLQTYRFDLGPRLAVTWVAQWQATFPATWVAPAILEAFYQGRYKAVSVEQILALWRSRGYPRLSYDLNYTQKIWPAIANTLRTLLEQAPMHPVAPRRWHFESFEVPWYDQPVQQRGITLAALQQQLPDAIPSKMQLIFSDGETSEPEGKTDPKNDVSPPDADEFPAT